MRGLAMGVLLVACGGAPSSSDASADDAAIDAASEDAGRACTADRQCDDGIYCDGDETCDAGRCASHPRVCDDGIACTVDRCDERSTTCVARARDADADGFGDASCVDAHGVPLGTDCDDADAARYPGHAETCDAVDDDCDPTTLGGNDADGDGAIPDTCCNPTSAGVVCGRDCDDTRASVSQLATEICDTIDNDCDAAIDEHTLLPSYPDGDFDGFGDASAMPELVCEVPSSRANQGGDCNDADGSVHPGAFEACNGADDDCDAAIDERCP